MIHRSDKSIACISQFGSVIWSLHESCMFCVDIKYNYNILLFHPSIIFKLCDQIYGSGYMFCCLVICCVLPCNKSSPCMPRYIDSLNMPPIATRIGWTYFSWTNQSEDAYYIKPGDYGYCTPALRGRLDERLTHTSHMFSDLISKCLCNKWLQSI